MRHIAAVLLLCTASQPSFCRVTESHSTQTYEVAQNPGASLLRALNSASPIRSDGHIYHGNTAWNVHWVFRWNTSSNGLCAITSVETSLSTTITLPRLRRVSTSDSQDFDIYLSALTRHEEGHKQLGQSAAQEIDDAIARLPPMRSCKELDVEANRTAREILDRTRDAEIEYDRSTRHGCTQGACLKR